MGGIEEIGGLERVNKTDGSFSHGDETEKPCRNTSF